MISKIFSAFAVAAVCAVSFVACNDNNVPVPASQDFSSQSFLADENSVDANEIFDDSEEGARAAAAIDTANQVKYQIKVTSACVSGSASVGFKYAEGSISSDVLSGTAINTAAGFKSFSVAQAKLNTVLLKTFDKTKSYTVYMLKTASVKAIPASGSTPKTAAVPAQYKKVTTLSANPAAAKKMNAAGTKAIGRPITTAVTTLACPS